MLTQRLLTVLCAIESGEGHVLTTSIPLDEVFHSTVQFTLDNGWTVSLFFDGFAWDAFDYMDESRPPKAKCGSPKSSGGTLQIVPSSSSTDRGCCSRN